MTISGTTVVHTLTGDKFAGQLALEDKPVHVFTWDGERVTVGLIEIHGPSVQVPLRVTLDDGSEIYLANGGRFVSRENKIVPARDLESGASLMPIYLKEDSDGYPTYREPGDWNKGAQTQRDGWNWRRVARMVAEAKLGRRCRPGDIVRHVDKNRKNCLPSNLFIDYRKPKMTKQKAAFAEPIFEAQRQIKKINHKIDNLVVDNSREMYFLRGKGITNVGVGGVFVSTDPRQ